MFHVQVMVDKTGLCAAGWMTSNKQYTNVIIFTFNSFSLLQAVLLALSH